MRAALALLLASGCAHYPARDAFMEVGVALSMGADMVTTKDATHRCVEVNPIIGHCGERMSAEAYFAAVTALHVVASYLIPEGRWRTAFQAVTIGVEGHAAWRNTLTATHQEWRKQ